MCDDSQDRPTQNPAEKDGEQIVVTKEMIDAGLAAYAEHTPEGCFGGWLERRMIEAIARAVISAQFPREAAQCGK